MAKPKMKKKVIDYFRKEDPVETIPYVPEVTAKAPVAPPAVEEKQVLCECGNPANPGSHQCWRCSHRT